MPTWAADRLVLLLVLTTCVAALFACSGDPSTPVPPPPVPTSTPPSTPANTLLAQGMPAARVPKDCTLVAPAAEVDRIAGRRLGPSLQIVGVPEPAIGRTERLACYYGASGGVKKPVGAVELGLAGYATERAAAQRVRATIDAERARGAAVNEIRLGAEPAVLLVGPKERTLMLALDRATVVVTARHGVVDDDQATRVLTVLGQRASGALLA
ncbi:hypothetical protein [Longimycelium tulufanense]|uniref:hypothetical protein n=1 Tax=Longimycelium tulufanense TaxID=907463 RepID=UPI001668AB97|nr:hypothetical protein [Longimycelium tulufanense]